MKKKTADYFFKKDLNCSFTIAEASPQGNAIGSREAFI